MFAKLFSALLIWFSGIFPHPAPIPSPVPVPPHPYYITSLQQRSYTSVIKTDRQVYSSALYSSYVVSFVSDGLTEYALMDIPAGSTPSAGWPVIILNHGHIAPAQYSTVRSYIVPAADFASAGFLVLKPDYRGNGNSQGSADNLTSRLEYAVDVLNLLAGVATLPGANSHRIYFWGHSMGGEVTLRALEICGNCVKAASLWAPAVTKWPESMLYFVRRNHDPAWLARVESELKSHFLPEDYSHISTLANLHLVKVPLNLHHGTADESVPYSWGTALDKQLTENRIPHTFYSYLNDNHNLTRSWSAAIARDIKFFNSTL